MRIISNQHKQITEAFADAWEKTKALLQSSWAISELEYTTWIMPLSVRDVQEDIVYLSFPSGNRTISSFISDKYGNVLREYLRKASGTRLTPMVIPRRGPKQNETSTDIDPKLKRYYILRLPNQDYIKAGQLIWTSEDSPVFRNALLRGELVHIIDGSFEEAYNFCSFNRAPISDEEKLLRRKEIIMGMLTHYGIEANDEAIELIAWNSPWDTWQLKKKLKALFDPESKSYIGRIMTAEIAEKVNSQAAEKMLEELEIDGQMTMKANERNEIEIESEPEDDGWTKEDD